MSLQVIMDHRFSGYVRYLWEWVAEWWKEYREDGQLRWKVDGLRYIISLGQPRTERHRGGWVNCPVAAQADLEMFRVSPWISYDPASTNNSSPQHPARHEDDNYDDDDMDEDIDMDAPQISTLRDEESPAPDSSPTRTGKFRVKLLVNETKPGTKFITFNGETGEEAGESEGEDEMDEEDEEDQLMDDDDEADSVATPAPLPPAPVPGPSTRGAPASRRGARRGRGGGRRRGRAGAPAPAPLMTTFEVSPAESNLARQSPTREPPDLPSVEASPLPAPTTSRKRGGAPKGTAVAQRGPRKSAPKKNIITIPAFSEVADLSEGYTGTAPSSPIQDTNTPEVENIAPSAPSGVPTQEDFNFNLEGVPLPKYPLPSKPFQVQPPPKIGTGYAPVMSIDRSHKKPRHWRQANREIRGIAGGRWFARSWVGEKESDYAAGVAAASAASQQAAAAAIADHERMAGTGLTLPKLPALSLSAPAARGPGRPKGSKAEAALSTAASSRSVSIVPDAAPSGDSVPLAGRSGTKKRSNLSTAVPEIESR